MTETLKNTLHMKWRGLVLMEHAGSHTKEVCNCRIFQCNMERVSTILSWFLNGNLLELFGLVVPTSRTNRTSLPLLNYAFYWIYIRILHPAIASSYCLITLAGHLGTTNILSQNLPWIILIWFDMSLIDRYLLVTISDYLWTMAF
jgi:hypothetical protein